MRAARDGWAARARPRRDGGSRARPAIRTQSEGLAMNPRSLIREGLKVSRPDYYFGSGYLFWWPAPRFLVQLLRETALNIRMRHRVDYFIR